MNIYTKLRQILRPIGRSLRVILPLFRLLRWIAQPAIWLMRQARLGFHFRGPVTHDNNEDQGSQSETENLNELEDKIKSTFNDIIALSRSTFGPESSFEKHSKGWFNSWEDGSYVQFVLWLSCYELTMHKLVAYPRMTLSRKR